MVFFKYFVIVLLTASIFSCGQSSASSEAEGLKIQIESCKTCKISLEIRDTYGDQFYRRDTFATEGTAIFDYVIYRPIVAQLNINEKVSNIFLKTDQTYYRYFLDDNGYISTKDHDQIVERYINELSYLSSHNCNGEQSIAECISCMDTFFSKKERFLESYKRLGLPNEYFNYKKADLYFQKYYAYAYVGNYRKNYIGLDEDHSLILDLLQNMDQNFLVQKTPYRAEAILSYYQLKAVESENRKKFLLNTYVKAFKDYPNDINLANCIYARLWDNPYITEELHTQLRKAASPLFISNLESREEFQSEDSYEASTKHWVDKDLKSLSDDYLDNKVVVLNFWFPGCQPCVDQIPEKNELIKHFSHHSNFELINVCSEFSELVWKKSINNHDMHGTHIWVPEKMQKSHDAFYKLRAFPTYKIVKNGKIVPYKKYPISSEEFYKKIEAHLESI